VIPCTYDSPDYFSEGLAAVEQSGKWGYVNTTGNLAVPCQYDFAWGFEGSLGRVLKGDFNIGKWGLVNKTGQLAAPCEYDQIDNFYEGMAEAQKNNLWGYVDTTGQEVISCQYDFTDNFYNGLAVVSKGGQYGLINTAGDEVVPMGTYQNIVYVGTVTEGSFYWVEQNGKWGIIGNIPDRDLGDINADGKIDTTDARLALQHIVGKNVLTGVALAAADVDKSGKVDTVDARLILQYIVKKIDKF